MAELERLPASQGPQTRRQIIGLRQAGAINQYRHYPDVSLQRRLDLDTDEIIGIVKSPFAPAIGYGRPISSDKGEKDNAPGDGLYNCLSKVDADSDGVNVHKDAVLTEMVTQPIE
jgi:hypothetical protein